MLTQERVDLASPFKPFTRGEIGNLYGVISAVAGTPLFLDGQIYRHSPLSSELLEIVNIGGIVKLALTNRYRARSLYFKTQNLIDISQRPASIDLHKDSAVNLFISTLCQDYEDLLYGASHRIVGTYPYVFTPETHDSVTRQLETYIRTHPDLLGPTAVNSLEVQNPHFRSIVEQVIDDLLSGPLAYGANLKQVRRTYPETTDMINKVLGEGLIRAKSIAAQGNKLDARQLSLILILAKTSTSLDEQLVRQIRRMIDEEFPRKE